MDSFDRVTRLIPLTVLLAPVVVLALLALAQIAVQPTTIWARLATLGAGLIGGGTLITLTARVLAGQVIRDAGKGVEPGLWQSWGGPPAVTRLRWRSATNSHLLAAEHAAIAKCTGAPLPTSSEEASDPLAADKQYETAVMHLIALTNDDARFANLKRELTRYNLWRNLYAIRRRGQQVASACALVGGGVGLIQLTGGQGQWPWWSGAVVVAVALIGWWALLATADQAHAAATRYADRLVNASLALAAEK